LTIVFGGMYTQYFACTFLIYFYESSKRVVLAASSGCIIFLVQQGIGWHKTVFIPRVLMVLGAPLYVSSAVSAVVFILLVYYLLEKFRNKTLAAALYACFYKEENTGKPELSENINELFTPEEIDVAMLLIEGKMRSEITRSLHLSAEEANKRISSIRSKVSNMGDPDPVIAAAIAEYRLTPRETDILRCFRREMTNVEIAAQLFLSEETVKTHVRNLLRKLKIGSRKDIKLWEESLLKNMN